MYLLSFQTHAAHEQLVFMEQVTLEFLNILELFLSPRFINSITYATRKLAHGLYHLVVIRIIEECLCAFVVPVVPHSTLFHIRRKYRKISYPLRIFSQILIASKQHKKRFIQLEFGIVSMGLLEVII